MQNNSGIGFIPYKGYIALAVPEEVYPTIEVMSKTQWLKMVNDKAQEMVTGELKVAAIGEGVDFVKLDDKVCLASHSKIQAIETDDPDRKYPIIWWVVRESDILAKFDK